MHHNPKMNGFYWNIIAIYVLKTGLNLRYINLLTSVCIYVKIDEYIKNAKISTINIYIYIWPYIYRNP